MCYREENINNLPHLIKNRKSLRKSLTSAEAALWLCLKNKQLSGVKFRRQYSIENFILDFYSPLQKLAIELDGHYHFTPEGMANDEVRDNYLEEQGIKVLRFENKMIFEQLENVLEEIKNNFK
jgi:very-short-patch-repair endonuclease